MMLSTGAVVTNNYAISYPFVNAAYFLLAIASLTFVSMLLLTGAHP